MKDQYKLRELLAPFKSEDDLETSAAYFQVHTPWVGRFAYFNIIYSPVELELLKFWSQRWPIPKEYSEFLLENNGAILFSNTLSLSGLVAENSLLRRSEPFLLPPFDLFDGISSWPYDIYKFFRIGQYTIDGSPLCIEQDTNKVVRLHPQGSSYLNTWPNLEVWCSSELSRISSLFDGTGRPCVKPEFLLPSFGTPS